MLSAVNDVFVAHESLKQNKQKIKIEAVIIYCHLSNQLSFLSRYFLGKSDIDYGFLLLVVENDGQWKAYNLSSFPPILVKQ